MEEETEFLLKRASEEARQAIASESPEAAEAHKELALRYSVKAVALLHEEVDPSDPKAQAKG